MKQAKFAIDTFPDQSFEGYSNGEEWNGWACPYFTLEEGQKILRAHNSNGLKGMFDKIADQFVFENVDENEFYPAIIEDGVKLYPIGNGSWIWEEST